MVVNVPTEVIPLWYIKKWVKENAELDSPLDTFIRKMIDEWRIEDEVQHGKCES